jgi:hypothetical protein
MKGFVRIAVAVGAMALSIGVPGRAVYAAGTSSISVTDVTIVLSGTATVRVEQDIDYSNLPDGSSVAFSVPDGVEMDPQVDSAATTPGCTSSQGGNQGSCGWLAGSGVIRTYLVGVRPAVYLGNAGNTVVHLQARVQALSLSASGAITIAPRPDLAVHQETFLPGYDHLGLAVFDLGPSASYGAKVTISDFYYPVTVTGSSSCQASGKTVTCTVPTLYAPVVTGNDPGTCQPTINVPACVEFDLTVSPAVSVPLHVTLTTVYQDPRPANNTLTAFANLPTPFTNPPVPPGSGSGGSGSGGSGPGGSPSSASGSATVTPSPAPGPGVTAGESSQPQADAASGAIAAPAPGGSANGGQSGHVLAWTAAGVGAGLLLGAAAGAVRLRRRRLGHREDPAAAGPSTIDSVEP